MSTYEASVIVTFMVDAEDEDDAISQIEETLQNVAYDWSQIRVEA
jgi:hypothetical protein